MVMTGWQRDRDSSTVPPVKETLATIIVNGIATFHFCALCIPSSTAEEEGQQNNYGTSYKQVLSQVCLATLTFALL